MTKQYLDHCPEYDRLTNEYIKAISAQDTTRLKAAIMAMTAHQKGCKTCKGEK
jgi:hypothetical protein